MAPRVTRVVLDTNVVLSALLFAQGRLAPLRSAWRGGRFRPLVSAAEQQELLADYLPYCETVHLPAVLPNTAACRDPFDVPFLQLAIVGRADQLVTGDKDLLTLADKPSCSIITAEQLLGMLTSE
jgi:predicted nucleic acid-binding protein